MRVLWIMAVCLCLSACSPGRPRALRFGYVLHGLNDFTQVIRKGAEDAGRALGVEVEVIGPASFEQPAEAQGMFERMIRSGKDGMAVVPNPGDVWVQALDTASAKLPVMTANISSPASEFGAWFGQDEYQSGVTLATELARILRANGVTGGRVVVGICAPGVSALEARYRGFLEGLEGSEFQASDAYDVTHEPATNYTAWQRLAAANTGMVAAVGLCSIDVPNLARLKADAGGTWLVGGYDLNVETLDAIRSGSAAVALGQHPYLQGYLPILALYRQLEEGTEPLHRVWIDVGTEVVTWDNVETVYQRESDPDTMTQWYRDYIEEHFNDLNALAQPMPGLK